MKNKVKDMKKRYDEFKASRKQFYNEFYTFLMFLNKEEKYTVRRLSEMYGVSQQQIFKMFKKLKNKK